MPKPPPASRGITAIVKQAFQAPFHLFLRPPFRSLQPQLTALKDKIWERRPILGEIMQKHGGKILYEYTKDFLDVNPVPGLDERKEELLLVVDELLEKRLGKKVADEVAAQLRAFPLVSTTDHHGPITHPFFLNANLISAIPYLEKQNPLLKYLVVFSFATVSLNNASAYPRGILFHAGDHGSGPLIRLPIMPDKTKMGVVYGMRPYAREELHRAMSDLDRRVKAGEIHSVRASKIKALLETYFGSEEVMKAPDLSCQITEVNFNLWLKLFHKENGAPCTKVPDLIYLDIETLVTEMLLRRHLQDSNSLIHRVLFDSAFAPLVLQHFNNIPGGFSIENDWGTYMFWGVDEKNHRLRLKLNGDKLESSEGTVSIPWNAQAVAQALQEKKIFPAMLLCYLMVSLYYGMKCLGGFCQVNDLTMTKRAWGEILRGVGLDSEAQVLEPVQTKELGGDGMVLGYLKTPEGALSMATGIDLALDDDEDTSFDHFLELSKTVTLSEMMAPMLPEMYTVLYSIHERDPKLAGLPPEQILKFTGLDRKLHL